MDQEEKLLILGLKRGNRADFDFIFHNYYQQLCKYSYTIVRDDAAAEDIVEECLFRLWNNRKRMNIHKSLKRYLFTSVHNISLNYLQHLNVVKKYKELQINIQPTKEIFYSDFNESPLQLLINKEFEIQLKSAIEQLPEQQKKVFKMNREHGRKYHEIAEELNISVTTVKSHMSAALQFLRKALERFL